MSVQLCLIGSLRNCPLAGNSAGSIDLDEMYIASRTVRGPAVRQRDFMSGGVCHQFDPAADIVAVVCRPAAVP